MAELENVVIKSVVVLSQNPIVISSSNKAIIKEQCGRAALK